MYTSFSSSTVLALRARRSFYDDYGYGSQSCPRNCSQSSLYATTRNPRYVYYGFLLNRHSRLFQLEPSRAFLLPRRAIRVRVCDGGFDEASRLLGECERCCCRCRCCKGEGFGLDDGDLKKSSKKVGSWTRFERKSLVGESRGGDFRDCLRKEGSWSRWSYDSEKDLGYSDDFECRESLGGVRKKVVRAVREYGDEEDYRRGSRNETNRKVFDRRVRDDKVDVTSCRGPGRESRANYKLAKVSSFSSDFEDREVQRSRVVGESFTGVRKKGYGGIGGVDEKEKVVKEIRKYEDGEDFSRNSRNETSRKDFDRRLRDEEENATSRRDSDHETREEYVYEELEGLRKQRRLQMGNSYNRSRVEDENIDDRIDLGRHTREAYVRDIYSERDKYSEFKIGSDLRNVDRGESSTSFVKRKSDGDQREVWQADSRKSSLRSTIVEGVSNSQTHLEEEKVKKSVRLARDESTQIDQREDDKVEINRKFDTNAIGSRILATDNETTNNSKSDLEIRREADIASHTWKCNEEEIIKVREDRSSSVENSVQLRRDERTRGNQQATNMMEFNKKYENQNNLSRIHASGTESANNSKSPLHITTDDRKERSTSVGNNSGVGSEWDSRLTEVRRRGIGRISNLHEVSTIRTETQDETSSSIMVHDKKDNRQSNLFGDSSQSTEASASLHGDLHSVYQVTNDVIESASKLDESSAVYVGEFVNKLRQETSALDNSEGIYQETAVIGFGVDDDTRRSEEKDVEQSGRRSSSRSTMEGPLDEIWETSKIEETGKNPSTVEVMDSKVSSAVISEDAIIRRSHRSLWAYIADIMKIGLGRRARSDNSPQKSGTGSSSNESVSSEAWFSGQEPDEGDEVTHKKKNDISPREPVLSERPVEQSQISLSIGVSHADEVELSQSEMRRQGVLSSKSTSPSLTETGNDHMHRSDSPKSQEFDRQELAGTGGSRGELRKRNGSPKESMPPTSMGTLGRDFPSKGQGHKSERRQRVALPSGGQSSVLPAVLAPPSVSEIGNVQMHESELSKVQETTEVRGTEGRDTELKRRKLHRNNQVLVEQFEEWEKAYKHESEQRKIDEYFMREALLEAKKAADIWEVPVGAVLVQNGKIIARGCNLVEELRDSTAHAEMICIREASNLLRTWRLAETTLYVTLEPCAMCAGAILQARIDAVVWGAPNKLLGADGSWVRLFPNGDGESSSILNPSTNQNSGPVHPFHPKITIRRGILATECSDVMQQFFQLRRKKNNKKQEPPQPPPPCLPISNRPTKLFARMHDLFCMMFCL